MLKLALGEGGGGGGGRWLVSQKRIIIQENLPWVEGSPSQTTLLEPTALACGSVVKAKVFIMEKRWTD